MALTDAWLKAVAGKDRERVEVRSDRDGLSARVSPKGKVVFQVRYRYGNKAQRIDVGTYPATSLKMARSNVLRLKEELDAGNDPKVVRRLERVARESVTSLEVLVRQWYEKVAVDQYATHEQILRTFELHTFPELGALPAGDIPLPVWMARLEKIKQEAPHIAVRVLGTMKNVYRWAVRRELVRSNPLEHITPKADLNFQRQPKDRFLTSEEIQWLIEAIDKSRIAAKNKIFLKLCLFFGCRNGELRAAEWSHFDFEAMTWTVPWQNHKMGKKSRQPIIRPVIAEVVPLLELARELSNSRSYLFTHSTKDEPVGHTAYLTLPYRIRDWVRKHKGVEMAEWSVHDLRRTARTNFSELTEPHVAEIILAHRLPGEWRVYDRHHYLDEQRECYQRWWSRLEALGGLA